MGIKQLYNDNLRKLPNEYGDVSVMNFSDSFFGEQMSLETDNRFVPLTKEKKDRSLPCGTNKTSFISGLKFISMNINSIRG